MIRALDEDKGTYKGIVFRKGPCGFYIGYKRSGGFILKENREAGCLRVQGDNSDSPAEAAGRLRDLIREQQIKRTRF